MSQIKVLMVCLGNICRSPLAEGAFRSLVEQRGLSSQFHIDSAGTGAWHVGESPDPRSLKIASDFGVDLTTQKSRVLLGADIERFDYIFAMDRSNLSDILTRHTAGTSPKVHLFLGHRTQDQREVPDPYYDRIDGFRTVWSLVHEGSQYWLDRIMRERNLKSLES